jgi:hypothetical protein
MPLVRHFSGVILIALVTALLPITGALGSWQEQGNLISTEPAGYQPAVAPDGSGGAVILWTSAAPGGDLDVYAQRIDALGNALWDPNGAPVCTSSFDQSEQAVAVSDGAGGTLVTYFSHGPNNSGLYAQRVDASGSILWLQPGVSVATTPSVTDGLQAMIRDGAGGAIVAWGDRRSDAGDIYAQRIDSTGALEWDDQGVAVCTAVGFQLAVAVAPDAGEGAVIAWSDWREPDDAIYAQRVDSSGAVQWTPDGVLIRRASIMDSHPVIVSDGTGGAIIAWAESRNGDWGIYAQRIDGSGSLLWGASGAAVCAFDDGGASDPCIASNGLSGAIIAWTDFRVGYPYNIYAQNVRGNGTIAWASRGVAVCTAEYLQMTPIIASDGNLGAVVAWLDEREDSVYSDIYAQALDASGATLWQHDGVPACTAPLLQDHLSMISDGVGGAIIAWQDDRDSNPDIYAQRVTAERVPDRANCSAQWQDLAGGQRALLCPCGSGSWIRISVRDQFDEPMEGVEVVPFVEAGCPICRCSPTTAWTDNDGIAHLEIHAGLDVSSDTSCCSVVTTVKCAGVTIPWEGTAAASDTTDWMSMDLDGDCDVTAPDYAIVYGDLGSHACRTDFNCDGTVGTQDLSTFSTHLVHSCDVSGIHPGPVPENVTVRLAPNQPNPFSPVTALTYSISSAAAVRLCIYDASGRLTRTLVDSRHGPGTYTTSWEGDNDGGDPVSSGMYFAVLSAAGQRDIRRLVILR